MYVNNLYVIFLLEKVRYKEIQLDTKKFELDTDGTNLFTLYTENVIIGNISCFHCM